jgi:DNA invertase Pin-like site-specific DNA recombinase
VTLRREPAAAPIALGYLRVSTEDQARDDRASLGQQEAAIRALATRRGFTLAQLFTDPGASGGSADRPAFQALLAYCAQHPCTDTVPGYVLVLNDSRWGRFEHPEEATYWREHLRRAGWLVRFTEGDDSDELMTRGVLRAIHSSTASAYREQIKATAKRGARGSAAEGFWQNEAPIGYRRRELAPDGTWGRTLEHGQRKSDGVRVKLTPGPRPELELILWLFEAYAAGDLGLWQLARLAHARWPEKRWSSTVVRHILTNRAYAGEVVWCRRPHDGPERRRTPVRSPDAWVVVIDAHPALIPTDLFAAVQARLASRPVAVRPKTPYLLTGLLRCQHCGDTYAAGGTSKVRHGSVERLRFYLHRQASWIPERRDPSIAACPELMLTLNQPKLEAAVTEAIAQAASQPAVRLAIGQAFDAAVLEARERPVPARETARRRRAELQRQRTRLVAAVGDGTMTNEDARPALEQNRLALEAVDAELQRGRFGDRRVDALAAQRAQVLQWAEDLPALLPRLPILDRRKLLGAWLQTATVDRAGGALQIALRSIPALEMGGRPGLMSQLQGAPLLALTLPLPAPRRRHA